MNEGRYGLRGAVGTRSQASRLRQAAATTGMTGRTFIGPLAIGDGGCDCSPQGARSPERSVPLHSPRRDAHAPALALEPAKPVSRKGLGSGRADQPIAAALTVCAIRLSNPP